jgi:hypothetical protein
MNVDTYLELVRAALSHGTDANIDAVDAFEAEYPEVVDAAYAATGRLERSREWAKSRKLFSRTASTVTNA